MRLFDIIAILITLSAAFSWLNHRYFKLPTVIGLMLIALVMSLALQLPLPFFADLEVQAEAMLAQIDFDETLLHGMLSFLQFAGALHVNLSDLAKQRCVSFRPRVYLKPCVSLTHNRGRKLQRPTNRARS